MKTILLFLLVTGCFAILFANACGDDDDDDDTDSDDDNDAADDDSGDDDDTGDDDDDSGDDDDEEQADLTVLTFNLQNPIMNPGSTDARTQIVIDFIEKNTPDLVAFQEVTESGILGNRAEIIAEAVGYQWTWEQTHNFGILEEGVAVLSRWPYSGRIDRELPHPELFGLLTRKVLGIVVETPSGDVPFFCSHMTVANDQGEKADQAVVALEFLHEQASGMPAFFAGDLNAMPDSTAMRLLRGEVEYEGVTGDLADSWMESNGDDPGYTFSAQEPVKRIDYIYRVPGDEARFATLACEHVFAEAVDNIYASDHIGVFCGFRVE